jgi:CubicO group peptidase (beta-lactamase class C family)
MAKHGNGGAAAAGADTPSSQRRLPRSHRQDTKHRESAARSELSGDQGQNLRGFGWDIDTGHSTPRGTIFPIGSFGHTGFTGISLWMDPGSDTYVILFANSIHVRGSPPMSNLQGEVATATAQALGL